MPQVARLALPGLTNIWVSVLKDTALVALAGLNEIVARSRTAAGATKEPFLFFIAAALFFILFSAMTLKFSARIERRLDRGIARSVAAAGGA
jgi:polar amino acid transport system permease protein